MDCTVKYKRWASVRNLVCSCVCFLVVVTKAEGGMFYLVQDLRVYSPRWRDLHGSKSLSKLAMLSIQSHIESADVLFSLLRL